MKCSSATPHSPALSQLSFKIPFPPALPSSFFLSLHPQRPFPTWPSRVAILPEHLEERSESARWRVGPQQQQHHSEGQIERPGIMAGVPSRWPVLPNRNLTWQRTLQLSLLLGIYPNAGNKCISSCSEGSVQYDWRRHNMVLNL